MSNTRIDTADIKSIYEAYEQSFLQKNKMIEEADKAGSHEQDLPKEKSKKIGKGKTKANLTKGGPTEEGGFKEPELDPMKVKDKDEYNVKKFSALSEKSRQRGLNISMSTKFDKLFEMVMDDETEDLGLDYEADDETTDGLDDADLEGGDDEFGDEVTVTLSSDLARQLCDALKGVLDDEGGDELGDDLGDDDLGDDLGGDELGGDDDDDFYGEGVDIKELPDNTSKLTKTGSGSHKVGDSNVDAGAGSPGDSKVTDKVGNDGEKGHPIKDDTDKGNLKNTRNFKVRASKGNKPGQNAFKD